MRKLTYFEAVSWCKSESIMHKSPQYVMIEVNSKDEARFIVASVFDVAEFRPERYAGYMAFARFDPVALVGGGYDAFKTVAEYTPKVTA